MTEAHNVPKAAFPPVLPSAAPPTLWRRIARRLDLGNIYDLYGSPDFWMQRALAFDMSALPARDSSTRLQFDLDYLDQVEARLAGVDRVRALRALAAGLREQASDEEDLFRRFVMFGQACSKNFEVRQPVHDEAGALIVSDPILLLELVEMRCGHSARMGVDLAEALGWQGRLLQLAGHVAFEVNVNDTWRAVDFDVLCGGEFVSDETGRPLSFHELNSRSERLDRLFTYGEAQIYAGPDAQSYLGHFYYPSYFYFSQHAYGNASPAYYEKTVSLNESAKDKLFGWSNYVVRSIPGFEPLDLPIRHTPSASYVTSVEDNTDSITIHWSPVLDSTQHISRFEVRLSGRSRGWNFMRYLGPPELQKYVSPGKLLTLSKYAQYPNLPHASEVIQSATNSVTIPRKLLSEAPILSIMPNDAYGDSIGKSRYAMSPEYNFSSLV